MLFVVSKVIEIMCIIHLDLQVVKNIKIMNVLNLCMECFKKFVILIIIVLHRYISKNYKFN